MQATTKLFAAILLAGAAGLASANSGVVRELADQQAAQKSSATLTRAQVRAEFLAAQAAGELIEGPNGETARELNPARYPAAAVAAAKVPERTRTEVKQELVTALRSGQPAASYYGL